MNKRYKNPPIVEALCEFQFIPGQPWDLTIPGLIYEKIKEKFPNKKQQQMMHMQFKPTDKGLEHKLESVPPRMQFLNKDKTILVQVGTDLLSINLLKPYTTWNEFRPLILKNLRVYRNIAKPKGIKRLGLKYINKINIPKKTIELTEYFKFYPYIPEELPQIKINFNIRVEIPYEKNRDILLLTLASTTPSKEGELSIILDLDYVMIIPEKITFKDIIKWIDKAHHNLENAFEECITDKTRILFEEVK